MNDITIDMHGARPCASGWPRSLFRQLPLVLLVLGTVNVCTTALDLLAGSRLHGPPTLMIEAHLLFNGFLCIAVGATARFRRKHEYSETNHGCPRR